MILTDILKKRVYGALSINFNPDISDQSGIKLRKIP
jgi:hypothetical protein